jgi:23S rRNA (adenine2030-N6)-methyltransferase
MEASASFFVDSMLSYRHGYHAGNHADVLKHTVLLALLDHLALKDKAFWVVDTHAGAGFYRLDHTFAQKTGEWREGVGRIFDAQDAPPAVADYLALVRAANGTEVDARATGAPSVYPGSPWILRQRLRPDDRLRVFELHTSDAPALIDILRGDRQVKVTAGDGYAGLKASWPPAPRRGLALIDPSYEVKDEYDQVVDAVADALKRFPTGIVAVWYPRLVRRESEMLPGRLTRLSPDNWLHVALDVRARAEQGMHGSGMVVLNPPWTLPDTLKPCVPWLRSRLALDADATNALDWRIA